MKKDDTLDPKSNARETVIHSIKAITVHEHFLNKAIADSHAENGIEWIVQYETKTGLNEIGSEWRPFRDKLSAVNFVAEFPVGSGIDNKPYELDLKELDSPNWWPEHSVNSIFKLRGEVSDYLEPCYEILVGAGVRSRLLYVPTKELWDAFSKTELDWYKDRFGANWWYALTAEYVANHFPNNSPAGYAARILYAYKIDGDNFTAGYLTRELKMVLSQTEMIAMKSERTKSKAGKGGGKSSAFKKESRLEAFLLEIEKLGTHFPDLNEQAIVNQAFDDAVAITPVLWNVGKGQKDEYLSTLRSKEPYKSRYWAIFDKTA